jgi:hypothetical protein
MHTLNVGDCTDFEDVWAFKDVHIAVIAIMEAECKTKTGNRRILSPHSIDSRPYISLTKRAGESLSGNGAQLLSRVTGH